LITCIMCTANTTTTTTTTTTDISDWKAHLESPETTERLSSVGRFGQPSPYLMPCDGSRELSMAFCRFAAVQGCVTCLGLSVDKVAPIMYDTAVVSSDGDEDESNCYYYYCCLSNGEFVKTRTIIFGDGSVLCNDKNYPKEVLNNTRDKESSSTLIPSRTLIIYSSQSLISDTNVSHEDLPTDLIRYGWLRKDDLVTEFVEVPLSNCASDPSVMKYQMTFKCKGGHWIEESIQRLASRRNINVSSMFEVEGSSVTEGISQKLVACGVFFVPGVENNDSVAVNNELGIAVSTANKVLRKLGPEIREKRMFESVNIYRNNHADHSLPENEITDYILLGLEEVTEDNIFMIPLQLKEENRDVLIETVTAV